ncbi:hypothetical protein pqer_cds_1043 [Pandoravirus quercus]|uniref:F-box incomplete domain containing protein n=1 Tax=Pandoravirus quercus TaxID=2107709 RepID=A0A2U7UAQ5_9VIRU|nr:hypothetical protein pqer_cds_1043 [Pandoravirus quercus]AVK75465.1 hypothetical protein pqer_cds_1043 [Pandoravirus quercus]
MERDHYPDGLPIETVDLLLNGSATDGRPFLPRQWRFSAAMVCRAWHSCVRSPSSSAADAILDAATPGARLFGDLWVTGRLACVSALSDGLASDHLTLDKALTWLRDAGASIEVVCATLLASGCADAVAHAVSHILPHVGGDVINQQAWPWFLEKDSESALTPRALRTRQCFYPCQIPPEQPSAICVHTRPAVTRVVCRAGRIGGLTVALSLCAPGDWSASFDCWIDDAARRDHADVLIDLLRRAKCPKGAGLKDTAWRSAVTGAWGAAGEHAAMKSLTSLHAFNASLPRKDQTEMRWLWVERAVFADAVCVLDWWERTCMIPPSPQRLDNWLVHALACGATASADWLAVRLGACDMRALAAQFACCIGDGGAERWADSIAWLERHLPIDTVLATVATAFFAHHSIWMHKVAPIVERWPVAGLDALGMYIVRAARAALSMGYWRLVDRLVAAVDRAVISGARPPALDLWTVATRLLGEAIAANGPVQMRAENVERVRSTLALLCALAHRTRPLDGWATCDGLTDAERQVPPLGDVAPDAWARWCLIRPLDPPPPVIARFARHHGDDTNNAHRLLLLLDMLEPWGDRGVAQRGLQTVAAGAK